MDDGMKKKDLAKNSAVAVGLVGLAIAAPTLLPVLALASKDYFGEVLSSLFNAEKDDESPGKITIQAVTGVLTSLSASFLEKIPEALSKDHNFHLETALARAYLDCFEAFALATKEEHNKELIEQAAIVLPQLRARVIRALNQKNPSALFPVQDRLRSEPSARAYLNHLSAESLILSLANVHRVRAIITVDTEITLRRWVNEERAHQRKALGIGPDTPLPDPLRAHLCNILLVELPQRLGETLKRDDFSKSWIAFQRAHLQAILLTVKNLEGSNELIVKKLENLTRLEGAVEQISVNLCHFIAEAPLRQKTRNQLLKKYLADLTFSLKREINESAHRIILETSASEQRLSGHIELGKEEILKAIGKHRTLSSTNRLHQLPPPSRVFTGREMELKTLLDRARNGVTILGLQGMGGIGKTALALKLAQILKSDYSKAQFYLDLKGFSSRDGTGARQEALKPADIMWHVVSAYNPEGKRPDNEEDLQGWYYSTLEGTNALLLLDNARDETQIEPLIPPTSCFLLVTSRHHFALSGMYDLNLEQMSFTDAESLLLKINPRVGPEAKRLAEQCGYLPLALELAAKALKEKRSLAPTDLIRQLEDKQRRLGLVEASFSLSYEMFGEDLRRRWRQLAIFPDTFCDHHASALWSMNTEIAKELLAEFENFSMLEWNAETQRYRMHDLARDFADARLDDVERHDIHSQYAHYFYQILKIANESYSEGKGAMSGALSMFDIELENIRIGQAWAAENAESDQCAAHLCIDYSHGTSILSLRLHPRERIRWFEQALVVVRRLRDKHAESCLLKELSNAYMELGNSHQAIDYCEQGLVIARERNDKTPEGILLGTLGMAYCTLDNQELAKDYVQQALEIARHVGDKYSEGVWLAGLGEIYKRLGQFEAAINHLKDARSIVKEIDKKHDEGAYLGRIGLVLSEQGEYQRAARYFEKAIKISRQLGDSMSEARWLGELGSTYGSLKKLRRAVQFHRSAIAVARKNGDRETESTILGWLGNSYKEAHNYKYAVESYERALNLARDLGDRNTEGASLGNLGIVYGELGENKLSVELLEQALLISREIGDRYNEGVQTSMLAEVLRKSGEYERAIYCLESAVLVTRGSREGTFECVRLSALGACCVCLREYDRAIEYYGKTLEIASELGNKPIEGASLGNLGVAYAGLGDISMAEEYMNKAVRVFDEIESPLANTFREKIRNLSNASDIQERGPTGAG